MVRKVIIIGMSNIHKEMVFPASAVIIGTGLVFLTAVITGRTSVELGTCGMHMDRVGANADATV